MNGIDLEVPEAFLQDTPATLVVEAKTKRLWAIQLDLLAKIDAVCRKHGIRYSVDSGTLIGAMRHAGFIPWDDDIDVIMPRKDFEKFKAVANDEFKGRYFFQTSENSPGYYRTFARLLNTETVAVLKGDIAGGVPMWNYRQCVFVDIMICDNIPDSGNERQAHFTALKRWHSRYWRARDMLAHARNFRRMGSSPGAICRIVAGFALVALAHCGINLLDRWYKLFESELVKYDNIKTKCGAPYTNRPYEILEMDDFDNLIDVDFEFVKVKAFARYDKILTGQYGDWRRHVIGPKAPMVYDLKGVCPC